MSTENRYLMLATVAVVSLIVLLFSVRITPARDLGQWDQSSDVTQWYRHPVAVKRMPIGVTIISRAATRRFAELQTIVRMKSAADPIATSAPSSKSQTTS